MKYYKLCPDASKSKGMTLTEGRRGNQSTMVHFCICITNIHHFPNFPSHVNYYVFPYYVNNVFVVIMIKDIHWCSVHKFMDVSPVFKYNALWYLQSCSAISWVTFRDHIKLSVTCININVFVASITWHKLSYMCKLFYNYKKCLREQRWFQFLCISICALYIIYYLTHKN